MNSQIGANIRTRLKVKPRAIQAHILLKLEFMPMGPIIFIPFLPDWLSQIGNFLPDCPLVVFTIFLSFSAPVPGHHCSHEAVSWRGQCLGQLGPGAASLVLVDGIGVWGGKKKSSN